MLTPVTYRVVGESRIVSSVDTGRVCGPDLVIILTERSSMCVKGRNPEVPETGSQTSRTESPAVRDPGCQRRPDAVCPQLSVAAAVSRSGIMGTGRNDLRGFQPDRRAGKLRTFPARPRPGRAGSRCGPPVRPPAHAFQVKEIMININIECYSKRLSTLHAHLT